MQILRNRRAPLLVAGVIGLAVAVAPIVAADTGASSASGPPQPHQACSSLGSTQSLCESPGNVQINDTLPQVDFFPYAGGAT